ncbi:unnamed protein product, partial [marine sediment metagenome]
SEKRSNLYWVGGWEAKRTLKIRQSPPFLTAAAHNLTRKASIG